MLIIGDVPVGKSKFEKSLFDAKGFAFYQQIVEIARRHQLMIFSDEIYDRLCMDGHEHVSIAALAPDLPCVTFSGLSKST